MDSRIRPALEFARRSLKKSDVAISPDAAAAADY